MDTQLSEHFTLEQLTATNRADLQEQNRILDDMQVQTLRNLAGLLEVVDQMWATAFPTVAFKTDVHSAYRCKPLNDAVGSNDRSQHLLCQAADVVPVGLEIGEAFRVLWKAVSDGRLPVGQLIFETAERSYGPTSWVHVSLGAPWREQSRCNQVLRMEHMKYTLLGRL